MGCPSRPGDQYGPPMAAVCVRAAAARVRMPNQPGSFPETQCRSPGPRCDKTHLLAPIGRLPWWRMFFLRLGRSGMNQLERDAERLKRLQANPHLLQRVRAVKLHPGPGRMTRRQRLDAEIERMKDRVMGPGRGVPRRTSSKRTGSPKPRARSRGRGRGLGRGARRGNRKGRGQGRSRKGGRGTRRYSR